MLEDVILAIDNLIDDIYSVEQKNYNNFYVMLIEQLIKYVDCIQDQKNNNELNIILLKIQESYDKKDMIMLSDLLLYELKPLLMQ